MDYALYRELLQNSADARAEKVVISFKTAETAPPQTPISEHNVRELHSRPIGRLTVRNNGELFKEDDWNRLREIARGNPNESKIGAFGVGFYSVFELTDEPLVHSGDTVTSFYYVGDQLHFRKDTVPENDFSKWTVIDLPYRAPGVLPELVSFTAFLTQSFMLVPLLSIELEIDDTTLLKLTKVVSPEQPLTVPSHINGKSPNGFLELRAVKSEAFQVTVEYMNITQKDTGSQSGLLGFGRKLFAALTTSGDSPMAVTSVTCFLRKVTGEMDVRVSRQFATKMKETLMKPPPKTAIISMLAYSHDEKNLSELKPPLSDYIFPKEFNDAKIFIGFPTKQSTSMLSHLAMNQLIPTMERTAIDMSNKFVKDWNEQMLYVGGAISRVVYEHEMATIHGDMDPQAEKTNAAPGDFPGNEAPPTSAAIDAACHIMSMFEMKRSAPDAMVGEWIALGFWKSSRQLSVPTQKGIKLSKDARIAKDATFVKHTPVLPQQVLQKCEQFIERAVSLEMLRELSPSDVLQELNQGVLTPEQMRGLVTWIKNRHLDASAVQRLLSAAVVSYGDNKTLCLGSVKTFQYRKIGAGLPIPSTCLPLELTELFSVQDLASLGWRELGIRRWVEYIVRNVASLPEDQNITLSKEFAKTALTKIGEAWHGLNTDDASSVYSYLNEVACIPTQLGMKKPSEAYMMPIALFPDLPVKAPDLAANYNFLVAIGLRETVDMAFVLKLLHNPSESNFKWSTVDLVKYLTKNLNALKPSDWQVLRGDGVFESSDGRRCQASDLFAPNKELASLGFPVLKWEEAWDSTGKEASLLERLGLRSFPTEFELFEKAFSTGAPSQQDIAIWYYLKHYDSNGYSSKKVAKVRYPIITCTLQGKQQRRPPSDCFYDSGAAQFGFAIVTADLRQDAWKLGVAKSPTMHSVLEELTRAPPRTRADAESKFTYLSTRIGDLSQHDIEACSKISFIPIFRNGVFVKFQSPPRTYLESATTGQGKTSFAKSFFDFISVPASAAVFLQQVGVRYQPTINEIVEACVNDPDSMYQLAASPLAYEDLLAEFAANWDTLRKDRSLVSKMQRSRFLLSSIVEKATDDSSTGDKVTYSLSTASEVVVVDDVINYNLFKQHIRTAPQVEALEVFYRALGSHLLSNVVVEETHVSRPQTDGAYAHRIQKRIVERVGLFLESSQQPAIMKASALNSLSVHLVGSITLSRRVQVPGVTSPELREKISACFDPRKPRDLSLFVSKDELQWFDVSKALIKRILKRPNPDAVIVLELQLQSDLNSLQSKGYNVNRLLRKRERERQQEQERQEQIERERREAQKRIDEERAKQAAIDKATAPPKSDERDTDPPPAYAPPVSAPAPAPIAQPAKSAPTDEAANVNMQGPATPQPPMAPPSGGFWGSIRKSLAAKQKLPKTPGIPQSVPQMPVPQQQRQPNATPNNGPLVNGNILHNGIRNTKPFAGKDMMAEINGDNRPGLDDPRMQPRQVVCNPNQVHDLTFVTATPSGLKCYVSRELPGLSQSEMAEARRFETVLRACAQVWP